jgi:hypothetical protein
MMMCHQIKLNLGNIIGVYSPVARDPGGQYLIWVIDLELNLGHQSLTELWWHDDVSSGSGPIWRSVATGVWWPDIIQTIDLKPVRAIDLARPNVKID